MVILYWILKMHIWFVLYLSFEPSIFYSEFVAFSGSGILVDVRGSKSTVGATLLLHGLSQRFGFVAEFVYFGF